MFSSSSMLTSDTRRYILSLPPSRNSRHAKRTKTGRWWKRLSGFLSAQDLAMVCAGLVVIYLITGESAELVCDIFTSLPAAVFTYQLLTSGRAPKLAYEATLCFWILHGTLVVFDHLLYKTFWYFFAKFVLMAAVATHVLAKCKQGNEDGNEEDMVDDTENNVVVDADMNNFVIDPPSTFLQSTFSSLLPARALGDCLFSGSTTEPLYDNDDDPKLRHHRHNRRNRNRQEKHGGCVSPVHYARYIPRHRRQRYRGVQANDGKKCESIGNGNNAKELLRMQQRIMKRRQPSLTSCERLLMTPQNHSTPLISHETAMCSSAALRTQHFESLSDKLSSFVFRKSTDAGVQVGTGKVVSKKEEKHHRAVPAARPLVSTATQTISTVDMTSVASFNRHMNSAFYSDTIEKEKGDLASVTDDSSAIAEVEEDYQQHHDIDDEETVKDGYVLGSRDTLCGSDGTITPHVMSADGDDVDDGDCADLLLKQVDGDEESTNFSMLHSHPLRARHRNANEIASDLTFCVQNRLDTDLQKSVRHAVCGSGNEKVAFPQRFLASGDMSPISTARNSSMTVNRWEYTEIEQRFSRATSISIAVSEDLVTSVEDKITFKKPFDEVVSISLANTSIHRNLVWEVKTNAIDHIFVTPNCGLLPAGKAISIRLTVTLEVKRGRWTELLVNTDRLVVDYAFVPAECTSFDMRHLHGKTATGKQRKSFEVFYV